MAKRIGALFATLSMKSNRFERGLAKASGKLKSFRKTFGRISKRIAGFGLAAAAAAGAGVVALAKREAELVDGLAKTADKLGVNIKALAGLQFAGKLAGVQVNQLNMGLQRFTRRVAEAAKGSGEAKDTLKALGLDAVELNNMGLDEQFLALADAFEKVEGGGNRVLTGFKLFDSEGVALVNLLGMGRKEIEGMFREAEFFGEAITRLDAAKVEKMIDSFTRLGSLLAGMGRQLLISVTPFVDAFLSQLQSIGLGAKSIGDVFVGVAKIIAKALGKIGQASVKINQVLAKGQLAWAKLFGTADEVQVIEQFLAELRDRLKELSFAGIDATFQRIQDKFERDIQKIMANRAKVPADPDAFFNRFAGGGLGGGGFPAAIERGSQADVLAAFRNSPSGQGIQNRVLQLQVDIRRGVQQTAANTRALRQLRVGRIP